MHSLLTRLLHKRGIEDLQSLEPEEKATYDSWQAILSKEQLTLEDVKHFCGNQIGVIEGKWADYSVDKDKKAELLPYYTVYKALLQAIDSPQSARKALEQQLTQLIN